MGQKDIAEKHLQEYNDVFADIVNVLLFDGIETVKPDNLENSLIKSQYKADDGKVHEQERDVLKFWKDGSVNLVLYGIENQTYMDKDMPLRIMGYDGQSYRSQLIKENGTNHYPVITLVLYFGMERWNGPRSLYESDNVPDYLKPYVSDYEINVFEIAYLEEEQVKKFTSDFKYVADYFVQMRTKSNYIPSKEIMTHVDAVLKIMTVLTKDKRFEEVQNSGKEVRTMCEVLDRVEEKGKAEGKAEGETLLANLMVKLFSLGRTADAELAANDEKARKRFYKEFNLEEIGRAHV